MKIAFALLLAPVLIAAKDAPLEPSAQPDWLHVRKVAEATIREQVFDPSSVQIQWTRGFKWSFARVGMITPKHYGWIGCLRFNAKNRLGGYVGFEKRAAFVSPEGQIKLDYTVNTSACDGWTEDTPLQAALIDAPAAGSAGESSVADELGKLASLKASGAITQAEFDTAKTKLLAK